MNEFKNTLSEFIRFLKNPEDNKHHNQELSFVFKQLLILFLIELPIMFVITMIIQIISYTGVIDPSVHKINDMLFDMPIALVLLMAVIVMPFIEEVIFRLYLRFKYNLPLQFIIFMNYLFKNKSSVESRLKEKWNRFYSFIFYFSAILFGFIHIMNYEISIWVIIFAPFLIFPQFTIGLFLGYIRVRFNLLSAFLFHAMHNFLFLGITILAMQSGEMLVEKETDDYKIEIKKEYFTSDGKYYSSSNLDTVKAENLPMINVISNVHNIDSYKIQVNDEDKANRKIDLEFISKSKSDSIAILLQNELKEVLKYKISSVNKTEEVWIIEITDSLKLNDYATQNIKNSVSTVNKDSIIAKNSNLYILSKLLSTEYAKNIDYNGTNFKTYSLKIPNVEFDQLKQILKNQFGLEFNKTNKEVEKYYLKFE